MHADTSHTMVVIGWSRSWPRVSCSGSDRQSFTSSSAGVGCCPPVLSVLPWQVIDFGCKDLLAPLRFLTLQRCNHSNASTTTPCRYVTSKYVTSPKPLPAQLRQSGASNDAGGFGAMRGMSECNVRNDGASGCVRLSCMLR
jgi:hypothetical protein